MILYKLYQIKIAGAKSMGMWAARTAVEETIDLDKLAEHMANHNTPYSKGAIKGVLTDMVACIKELMLENKQVKLPDLAIFTPRISCTPADTPGKFTVKGNVRRVYVSCRGTGDLTSKVLSADSNLREYGTYTGAEDTTTP